MTGRFLLSLALGGIALLAQSGRDWPRVLSQDGGGTPAQADSIVRLSPEVTLSGSPDEPEVIFGHVVSIAADPNAGIAVLDRMAGRLSVFSPTGEARFGVGRRGRGPGEFSADVLGVAFTPEGDLVVVDPGLDRLTRFDSSGELVGTRSLGTTPGERVVEWRQIRPGLVAERVWGWAPEGDRIQLRDLVENEVRLLREFEYERPLNPTGEDDPIELLGTRPLWAVDLNGTLAWSYSETAREVRLWIRGSDGSLREGGLPDFEGRALTEDERERLRRRSQDGWGELMGRDPRALAPLAARFSPPDTLPGLTGLHSLGGKRILVQGPRGVDDLDGRGTFSLFHHPLGGTRWMAVRLGDLAPERVEIPEDFRPMGYADGILFGVLPDELGVEDVLGLRVRVVPGEAPRAPGVPSITPSYRLPLLPPRPSAPGT